MKTCVLVTLTVGVLLGAESGNEATTPEIKKLAGTWTVTSVVRNRNELPEEMLKDLQMIFRDRSFTFQKGDRIIDKGTFQLDPDKTPRAIDLKTTDDGGNERTTFAIYELLDDTLRICGSEPGKERPNEFAATDESGHTLSILRRAKP